MRGPVFLKGGLGSRFALRTYLLFCLCALVPVGIFGAIGYGAVSAELHSRASQRLTETSKHYGLLLNDRLIQAEKALSELARAQSLFLPKKTRSRAIPDRAH